MLPPETMHDDLAVAGRARPAPPRSPARPRPRRSPARARRASAPRRGVGERAPRTRRRPAARRCGHIVVEHAAGCPSRRRTTARSRPRPARRPAAPRPAPRRSPARRCRSWSAGGAPDRAGDPDRQPAAAVGDHDRVGVGQVLEDLQADRAVAGHHRRVLRPGCTNRPVDAVDAAGDDALPPVVVGQLAAPCRRAARSRRAWPRARARAPRSSPAGRARGPPRRRPGPCCRRWR